MAAALITIGNSGGTNKSTNKREWRIKETPINMTILRSQIDIEVHAGHRWGGGRMNRTTYDR